MTRHEFPICCMAGKKIIIAGGGMAGLAFAIALRQNWDTQQQLPEIIIYERDSRELGTTREGYSLSLNGLDKDGGLVTLRELGLLDKILDKAVLGMDGRGKFTMWDSNWNELMSIGSAPHDGLPTSTIRIARRDLRNVLVEAAEEGGNIGWGVSCVAAEKMATGKVSVRLQGTEGQWTEECDLLVAADGSRSKIRATFRPQDTLEYAGAIQLGGQATFAEGAIPKPLDENWGMLLSNQGVACFVSPVDSKSVVWGLSRMEEVAREAVRKPTAEQAQSLAAEARQLGSVFTEPFQSLVAATPPDSFFAFPAMDKKPFSHADIPEGIVFLGDSNHAVSPFAGNGANLALKDGLELAKQLRVSASLSDAVVAYDKGSLPRASATLRSSHMRIAVGHWTGIKGFVFRNWLWAMGGLMRLVGK